MNYVSNFCSAILTAIVVICLITIALEERQPLWVELLIGFLSFGAWDRW